MLINTVILFIRDTLPIFLLFSLLLALPGLPRKVPVLAVGAGLLLAVVLYFNLGWLTELADGAGLELLKIAALVLAWLSLCFSMGRAWRHFSAPSAIGVGLLGAVLTAPNAIHFLIYSVAYWPSQGGDMNLVFGTVIGLGISVCLAVLLFLLISPSVKYRFKWLLLVVFCAGQIAPIAVLLEQIDYLPNQSRLWDTSRWVADESEYGHLLNVLIGYEATPSMFYLLIYLLALAGPLVVAAWLRKHSGQSDPVVRCL